MFLYLIKLLFSGLLPFKGNFVCGQNNSKYRDWAPLSLCQLVSTFTPCQLDSTYPGSPQSHSQRLRSPWPAVEKRELWEQPFQACAIDADWVRKTSSETPISFPESLFPLTSGRKTRALEATISGMRHRCRLRSETGRAEFGYYKMVASRALVFRPLVKGNKDSGNEIGVSEDVFPLSRFIFINKYNWSKQNITYHWSWKLVDFLIDYIDRTEYGLILFVSRQPSVPLS